MIQNFIQNETEVYIFTVNGDRMQGVITDNTSEYLILNKSIVVYKHAISTIRPV